ncbi:MAG: hypothetical protein O4861_14810 [Trichodesmium sp. St16_bin4-tuft]|nr:hypothetical protein [Trichodesmium sp. St4_bin8_1]MDE5071559.1 hypothetical protein [Trichodesmium sp. St5_bin8]MDE5079411.1 hypothetical protein [Trichodesmium sp. St2_bin6]MDE5099528.1 hypothetical protein [Trichodesmium sp. St16_bin4-tuft]MDE5103233.1 hypothetical protein [Trichodesmium sp. St19_bin2]
MRDIPSVDNPLLCITKYLEKTDSMEAVKLQLISQAWGTFVIGKMPVLQIFYL